MIISEKNGQTVSPFAEQLLALTPSLLPLAESLEEAATGDMPVLLTGPPGTGKARLARLLHQFSPRGENSFVEVRCGALAPNSHQGVLFGQVQDASEGTDRIRAGRLEAASMGTLLLKDLDALPLEAQTELVHVIQTGVYEPIDSEEIRFSRARLIATVQSDIEQDGVKSRLCRELHSCFSRLTFYLPPLSQRHIDIEPLAWAIVIDSAKLFHKRPPILIQETLQVLQSFPWPGNIRQLEASIQHAVLVSSGDELRVEHLPPALREFSGGIKPRR